MRQSELFSVSSYKDTNPVGSELHPYDLINLNYFLRGPTSKESHPGQGGVGWGLELQYLNLGGYKTIQCTTLTKKARLQLPPEPPAVASGE